MARQGDASGLDGWSGRSINKGMLRVTTKLIQAADGLNTYIGSQSSEVGSKARRSASIAASEAARVLLPADSKAFSRGFAKKSRNSTVGSKWGGGANESWSVGFNSKSGEGSTREVLAKHVRRSTAQQGSISIKNKQVNIAYTIPKDVSMKIAPRKVAMFNKMARISDIEKWVTSKGVLNKGAFRNIKGSRKHPKRKKVAFIIAKSWMKKWKPTIATPDILSIGRNERARSVFASSFKKELGSVDIELKTDFMNLYNKK